MNKDKALELMKGIKQLGQQFGDSIPKKEFDFVDSIINKLESNKDFKALTKQEYAFVEETYKEVYD